MLAYITTDREREPQLQRLSELFADVPGKLGAILRFIVRLVEPEPTQLTPVPGPVAEALGSSGRFAVKALRDFPAVAERALERAVRQRHDQPWTWEFPEEYVRRATDILKAIADEFAGKVRVGIGGLRIEPTSVFAARQLLAESPGWHDFLRKVLEILGDLPKGALEPAKTLKVAARFVPKPMAPPPGLYGRYYPESRTVYVFPSAARTRPPEGLPQTITHELTHAVSEATPEARELAMKYIRDAAGWALSREEGLKKTPWAMFLPERPPRTYEELSALPHVGAGTWIHVPPDVPAPPSPPWRDYWRFSPLEDIAEAGSYAVLEAMPRKYAGQYAAQIEALRRNPRYEAIKKLLRAAGVEI